MEQEQPVTKTTYKGIEESNYLDLFSVDMKGPYETITEQIMYQMTHLGFLLLSNVPGYDEEELFKNQKWYFSQSEEEKKKLYKTHFNRDNTNRYRGHAPFIDNDPSHKELYEVGLEYNRVSDEEKQYPLHEETPWPDSGEEAQEFKKFMLKHYDNMQNLGIDVMQHIALGLGKPKTYFDSWFNVDTCSTLRIIRYLPRETGIVQNDKLSEEEVKYTTPIHTDSGFLTFLSTFGYPGLEVNVGDDTYKPVRPVAQTIVVNLGDMISRITDYKLKATLHRVLDIGCERYSSPFFFEPHYKAAIPTLLKDSDQDEEEGEKFIYGDFVIKKMQEKFGEFKDLFK